VSPAAKAAQKRERIVQNWRALEQLISMKDTCFSVSTIGVFMRKTGTVRQYGSLSHCPCSIKPELSRFFVADKVHLVPKLDEGVLMSCNGCHTAIHKGLIVYGVDDIMIAQVLISARC